MPLITRLSAVFGSGSGPAKKLAENARLPRREESSAVVSRRQPLHMPALARARVTGTVVQPVISVLPELDRVRPEPEAAPVRRTRHLAPFVLALELRVAALELFAALERMALLRGPRRKLTPPRARGEVRGRFGLRDPLDLTFHSDLLAELPPVEDEGRTRVLLELAGLATAVAAVEDEALLVDVLEQDHPR